MSTHSEPRDDDGFADLRHAQREIARWNARRFRALMADMTCHLPLHDEFEIDDYGTITIGDWGGYHVQVMPMIFNDRLVLTPVGNSYTYDHGWCYDKGGAVFLAAAIWNPETEGEPTGYKKRATPGVRQPGERATDSPIGLVELLMLYGLLPADLSEQDAQRFLADGHTMSTMNEVLSNRENA